MFIVIPDLKLSTQKLVNCVTRAFDTRVRLNMYVLIAHSHVYNKLIVPTRASVVLNLNCRDSVLLANLHRCSEIVLGYSQFYTCVID